MAWDIFEVGKSGMKANRLNHIIFPIEIAQVMDEYFHDISRLKKKISIWGNLKEIQQINYNSNNPSRGITSQDV